MSTRSWSCSWACSFQSLSLPHTREPKTCDRHQSPHFEEKQIGFRAGKLWKVGQGATKFSGLVDRVFPLQRLILSPCPPKRTTVTSSHQSPRRSRRKRHGLQWAMEHEAITTSHLLFRGHATDKDNHCIGLKDLALDTLIDSLMGELLTDRDVNVNRYGRSAMGTNKGHAHRETDINSTCPKGDLL